MDEFKVHRLNRCGLQKADQLAEVFETALAAVRAICANDLKGTGAREMALVATKMQEASFFAKRAMALDPANQATDVWQCPGCGLIRPGTAPAQCACVP